MGFGSRREFPLDPRRQFLKLKLIAPQPSPGLFPHPVRAQSPTGTQEHRTPHRIDGDNWGQTGSDLHTELTAKA